MAPLFPPANTRRSPSVGSMPVQRLRRWPSIKPTLGERLVFASLAWIPLPVASPSPLLFPLGRPGRVHPTGAGILPRAIPGPHYLKDGR